MARWPSLSLPWGTSNSRGETWPTWPRSETPYLWGTPFWVAIHLEHPGKCFTIVRHRNHVRQWSPNSNESRIHPSVVLIICLFWDYSERIWFPQFMSTGNEQPRQRFVRVSWPTGILPLCPVAAFAAFESPLMSCDIHWRIAAHWES